MTLNSRVVDGVYILEIEGEIDLYNNLQITDKIKEAMDNNYSHVLINLAKCEYIDSSGIGVLIASLSKLKKMGGSLRLCNVYQKVRKIFELTKLTGFFSIYDSEEEAMRAFQESA